MSTSDARAVSLTSNWFIRPGCQEAADAALRALARDVERDEPDTLTYLVHAPFQGDSRLQALPPADPLTVLFFETYRDAHAFLQHVNGPAFTTFVQERGDLFVQSNGKPFTIVKFLETRAGFVRMANVPAASADDVGPIGANQHPSVMFELIAGDPATLRTFYADVFGWNYATGSAYIPFPARVTPLLGGIGQTEPNTPGFKSGKNFYLCVDDFEATIARARAWRAALCRSRQRRRLRLRDDRRS